MAFKKQQSQDSLGTSREIVGKWLRIYRNTRCLSQERLGYKIGLSYQQIQKYESGKSEISLSIFFRLCRALEIEPQDFMADLTRELSLPSAK